MEMIEVTGNSVEDAINAGLAQLNAKPGDVMVEVLEEPSSGIFGFGAKVARVRLVLIGGRKAPEPLVTKYEVDDVDDDDEMPSDNMVEVEEADLDEDARVGKEVLEELLDKMQIEGTVTVHRAEAASEQEQAHWMLNINGDNMNRLIGRRGETLSSLQYIIRLISSRRLQRRANIIVDAAGYKSGRSDRLRGLAKRMAKQAVDQGRTITLEPMPPNERRIIHLTLRGRNDVTTRSVGEGRTRKVTIVPK